MQGTGDHDRVIDFLYPALTGADRREILRKQVALVIGGDQDLFL